jgi:hypothetical protein
MRHYLTIFIFGLLLSSCSKSEQQPEMLFEAHCGSCHLPPDPAALPKAIWQDKVLPEMAARMGIVENGYNPLKGLSKNEKAAITQSNVYPQQPRLSMENWVKIKDYIRSLAPDSLQNDMPLKLDPLTLFKSQAVKLDENAGSFITLLAYQKAQRQFLVGNVSGELVAWQPGMAAQQLGKEGSTLVAFAERNGRRYLTEIGEMPPTQQVTGKLTVLENGRPVLVNRALHRPVHSLVEDLDCDGQTEVVVSEYGNHTGRLTLLQETGSGKFERRTLLAQPGAIRTVAHDMDGDGRLDLVTLFAQGDEGVTVFYQKENLQFVAERVLRFSPVYGSSWMELVDYEGDGDMDIVTVQGDNADYSFVSKPYHGLRIFTNDGRNHFTESYFRPIYGATRLVAEDFDQDGDMDFAVAAYFPDFAKQPEASFVYLENRNAAGFEFAPQSFPQTVDGRWLVMEAGDCDGDGDTDLLLGSFVHSPAPTPGKLLQTWRSNGVDMMLLKNQLKSH